ncbi:uncharacterized protein LOC119069328 isoform X2 [Bradysia coprophila]|uniref:uncharacterized protein LOC119069328 isoform X2 n=1 Tax=Bradysia coprophila TaxID=38358 RepID=UPI00187DAD58|nr:uncharacterized protein LOC119069328 isoform X2 [Bradysia coprophila]
MIKLKLATISCVVIIFISVQFVAAQSYDPAYEYDEDVHQYSDDGQYINYPTFGLREAASTKLNRTTSQSKKVETAVKHTTPRGSYRRRSTFSTTNNPTTKYTPTQRVQIIPTSSPRSKLHEPGRILTKNEFVFVNEIEQTKNFTTSDEVQQHFKELNFGSIADGELKSPSRFIETTYKIDHSQYADNSGHSIQITDHNFDSKNLFSSDVTAKKVENSDGSGYFKTIGKYDLNKLSHRPNKYPIHDKLKTDLAVADLQLHSFPRPLKNFHHQHLPHSYSYTTEKSTTKSAATQEQIKLYNDDVKKHYDRVLEQKLRTSKDPADKAKYHQFIKAMEDEKIEQQSASIRDLKRQRPIVKPARPRPFSHETRTKSPEKTFGLGYYKLGITYTERPYKFPFL